MGSVELNGYPTAESMVEVNIESHPIQHCTHRSQRKDPSRRLVYASTELKVMT